MNTIEIVIEPFPDEETETVSYMKQEDGWHVNTESIDGKGWRLYAMPEARPRDVEQLLRKEYDARY